MGPPLHPRPCHEFRFPSTLNRIYTMRRSHSFSWWSLCRRTGPPGGEDGGEFLVGGPMRARTERNCLREPLTWLAAAVWLWAGQVAWTQTPGSPASAAENGSLGLKAGEEIP